jgi:DNA-directed RNA polymerase subunit N (RpoN/RPB10)
MTSSDCALKRLGNSLQARYERYQRRIDPKFPDKCETCGLRVEYFDASFDSVTSKVAELEKLGLARYAPRDIHLSTDGSPNR